MAHGIDRSEVEERGEIKSIGRETTFQEDTANLQIILKALEELSADIHNDVSAQHLYFKTVTVKVRYENFETHTHGRTLPFLTDRLQDLSKTANELVQSYLTTNRKIRLVGVRVSNFVSGQRQKTLI
jgi:nucleotidyltransferase/DNA polymerase involved in DNA repair